MLEFDFNALVGRINHLMAEAQLQCEPNLQNLRARHSVREALKELYDQLTSHVEDIGQQIRYLPRLPQLPDVEWAISVLALPNLAFLVLDTTGLQNNADIINVLVVDGKGTTLFDRMVQPQRQPNQSNYNYTRITQTALASGASSLSEVWEELRQTLAGKFVLSYNAEFVDTRLRENAKYYGLAPIFFVGACLQNRATEYYHSRYSLKLADACYRVGHRLPDIPSADDRAQGQLFLLQAMAQGITNGIQPQQPPTTFDDSPLGEIDEHPF